MEQARLGTGPQTIATIAACCVLSSSGRGLRSRIIARGRF
jgi:hypothetical protein